MVTFKPAFLKLQAVQGCLERPARVPLPGLLKLLVYNRCLLLQRKGSTCLSLVASFKEMDVLQFLAQLRLFLVRQILEGCAVGA